MTFATIEFQVFTRQLQYLFDLVFFGFHCFSLNSCMTDENYRLRQATLDWLCAQKDSYTHALTLTMKQTRKLATERGDTFEKLTAYNASRNMRHFLNRLNVSLYGNAAKAKRGGKSIRIVSALEGGITGKNFHYHCVIGNLPERLSDTHIGGLIRTVWQQTGFGNEQVDIQRLTTTGWMGYMVKELGRLSCDVIDWENVRN